MFKERNQCVEHYNDITGTQHDITCRLPFMSEARFSNNLQPTKQRLFALERKLTDHDDVIVISSRMCRHGSLGRSCSDLCYYLPHHCVFKDSTTTKLRVVFDASSKSPNGYSQNNGLLFGPCLQGDVFDILIQCLLHKHALPTDVAKM